MNDALARTLMVSALKDIARGRADNGRPLSGEVALQIARSTLVELGIDWAKAPANTSGDQP